MYNENPGVSVSVSLTIGTIGPEPHTDFNTQRVVHHSINGPVNAQYIQWELRSIMYTHPDKYRNDCEEQNLKGLNEVLQCQVA